VRLAAQERFTTAIRQRIAAVPGGTGKPDDLLSYAVLPPAEDQPVKSLPLFYTLNKSRSAGALNFFYNATYVMQDGTTKDTGDLEVTNRLQIVLPPVASAEPPGQIHLAAVPIGQG
jgi:hypothetical protein